MKTKLFLVAFLFVSIASFSQNIAFISQDSILDKMPNYKINLKKLDSLTKMYQEEIKTTSENLNKKAEVLLANYNVQKDEQIDEIKKRMTANDVSKFDLVIDENKFNLQKAKTYEEIIKTSFNNDIQTIYNKVNKAIEDYAKKNKIDSIFILEKMQPALAYLDKKKNVTQAIIQSLGSIK